MLSYNKNTRSYAAPTGPQMAATTAQEPMNEGDATYDPFVPARNGLGYGRRVCRDPHATRWQITAIQLVSDLLIKHLCFTSTGPMKKIARKIAGHYWPIFPALHESS